MLKSMRRFAPRSGACSWMTDQATIAFIPHGGGPLPLMNDRNHENLVRFLREYPSTIPKPDAIVVVSAHWEADEVAITAASSPALLFDYYGFPPETYQYEYPAPGHPQLAERVHGLLSQAGIASRLDPERDFDHGVFVPLMLMYPDAEIPCIQLSLCSNLDAAHHVRVGKALAALKSENLLVLGSGFSFHNLPVIMGSRSGAEDARNREFEAWLAQTCSDVELAESERERRLVDWVSAPHARYCHPREEHLLPLQVCYGIAQAPAQTVFHDTVGGLLTSGYQWISNA